MAKTNSKSAGRKVIAFTSVSLDGFFVGANGDMSWAHKHDPEWNEFVSTNAQGECEMLFGRVTYQMMAGWWPTPQAMSAMPSVAEGMNASPKIVFSRTLKQATWQNTRLIRDDVATSVRKLKKADGPMILILGSGSLVAQLSAAGLVDEFQIALNPIVLGRGRTLFEGLTVPFNLRLTETRAFKNGNVFLRYINEAR